jgi:hypothetical protein
MQHIAKEKEPLTVAAIRNAHVKQLQWGVKFIRQNLGELRAGEWLSLKEALYDFTLAAKRFPSTKRSGLSVVVEKYDEERFIQEMSPGVVQDIQSHMIEAFNALASRSFHAPEVPGLDYGSERGLDYGFGVNEVAFTFGCSSSRSPFVLGFGVLDNVQAASVAMGLHLVGSMLTLQQFLRCPECKTIFISNRKPRPDRRLHCSIRCSRGAASRRYREKLQARQSERTRANRRYEKKIRARWPKTPIAKRRSSTGHTSAKRT